MKAKTALDKKSLAKANKKRDEYAQVVKTKEKKEKKKGKKFKLKSQKSTDSQKSNEGEELYVNMDETLRKQAEEEMWGSMVKDLKKELPKPPPRKRSVKVRKDRGKLNKTKINKK